MSDEKDRVVTLPFLALLVLGPILILGTVFMMMGATLAGVLLGGDRVQGFLSRHPGTYINLFFGITAIVMIGCIATMFA